MRVAAVVRTSSHDTLMASHHLRGDARVTALVRTLAPHTISIALHHDGWRLSGVHYLLRSTLWQSSCDHDWGSTLITIGAQQAAMAKDGCV